MEGSFYRLLIFAVVPSAVTLIRQVGLPFKSVFIPTMWGLDKVILSPLRTGFRRV